MNKSEQPKRPSYNFAKTQGIVVAKNNSKGINVYHLATAPLWALAEVERMSAAPLTLHEVDEHSFQKQLAEAYQSQDLGLESLLWYGSRL